MPPYGGFGRVPRTPAAQERYRNSLVNTYGNILREEAHTNVVGQLVSTVKGASQVESEMLRFMGDLLSDKGFFKQYGPDMKAGHERVGYAAQRSMVAAYTHRRHRRPQNPYRLDDKSPNERYAGGALRRALSAQGHVEATDRGLSFINANILDQAARQWRRLNYGAGGKAGEAPRSFDINWGGLVVGALGLPPDPRPAFRIPRGYWIGPDGNRVGAGGSGDRFFPVSSTASDRPRPIRGRPSADRVTAGIAASNFLDAGVRRIANEIPPTYAAIYRNWFDNNLDRLERFAAATGSAIASGGEEQYFLSYRRDFARQRLSF